MKDDYVYPGTEILKNKLNITDEKLLKEAEANIVPIKLLNVDEKVEKNFDFKHLKEIHKYLFNDLYEFAGETRKIDIEKSEKVLNGLSVQYSTHEKINKDITEFFKELKIADFKGLKLSDKVKKFCRLTSKLWKIHPFREGNTRTIMTFMSQYGREHDINLNPSILSKNVQYVRDSLVLSSIGEYSEPEHFERIIQDAAESKKVKEYEVTKENYRRYKVYLTTTDINLNDGTFIKKGTEFTLENKDSNGNELKEDYMVVHFFEDKNNIYTNEYGEYKFNFKELNYLAEPEPTELEKEEYRREIIKEKILSSLYDESNSEEEYEKKLNYINNYYGDMDKFTERYIQEVIPEQIGEELSLININEIIEAKLENKEFNDRLMELIEKPIKGEFNESHLRKINHFLTGNKEYNQDGMRRINELVVKPLKMERYLKGMDAEQISSKLTEYYFKIDDAKPFEEGNIVTAKEFIRELAAKNGYELNINKVDFSKNVNTQRSEEIRQLSRSIKECFTSLIPDRALSKEFEKGIEFNR